MMQSVCRAIAAIATDRRGVVALEFVIAFPIAALFIVGLMEVGRGIWTLSTLDYAAETAARCAAVDAIRCPDTTATRSYAVSQAAGLNVAAGNFTVTPAACGMQVEAALTFTFVLDWVLATPIVLSARSCYPT